MNMHEECLKRQNEGYHTPLPEVIKRIERDSQKIKPNYDVLNIQDAVFYLKYLESLLQKAYEKASARFSETKMKTLDEVIEELRYQMGLGDPVLVDALHFLKELRYILDNMVWVEKTEGHWEIPSQKESHDHEP